MKKTEEGSRGWPFSIIEMHTNSWWQTSNIPPPQKGKNWVQNGVHSFSTLPISIQNNCTNTFSKQRLSYQSLDWVRISASLYTPHCNVSLRTGRRLTAAPWVIARWPSGRPARWTSAGTSSPTGSSDSSGSWRMSRIWLTRWGGVRSTPNH